MAFDRAAAYTADVLEFIAGRVSEIEASGNFANPAQDVPEGISVIAVVLTDRHKALNTLIIELEDEHRAAHIEMTAVAKSAKSELETMLASQVDQDHVKKLADDVLTVDRKHARIKEIGKISALMLIESMKREFPLLLKSNRFAIAKNWQVYEKPSRTSVLLRELVSAFGDMPGFAGAAYVGKDGLEFAGSDDEPRPGFFNRIRRRMGG
ncbi:MAG: hypothetical protein KBC38_02360 [Candidatus Pacebacteria bacterium]|nr:hypothetical protein [Candidatus Paceibacterota bacterium]MBP9840632.1 hypothetical protein [Candidatus Paceibacterota bacterium]